MEERQAGPGGRVVLRGRATECAALDRLVADVRQGESRTLVLRGEAGVGKSALLDYLIGAAPGMTVLRSLGVESEMELAYASLHQLCQPLLGRLGGLPRPQREALETVFYLSDGPPPDPFLVSLATLGLLTEVSEEGAVLCVIDDAQWLDQSSGLALAFVARRLLAEPIGCVFAAREASDELRSLPRLDVRGLRNGDARAVLDGAVGIRLDDQVRDRIVAETRGNPLALLELPRSLSATELAGFGTGALSSLPSDAEASFRRRLATLPETALQLLLVAAADPLGEPALVWRAAELQGLTTDAAAPVVEEDLCEFGARVRFRHPLIRAVAYRMASRHERRQAHAALAQATDASADPDRRAWHLALASAGPDDAVADELERSAGRARARGGQAAAAAFLERAVDLTVEPARQTERALAAAEAKHLAGMGEDAMRLASVAERGPLNELQRARVEALRGRVATMERRARDAPALLLRAAQRLMPIDQALARDTYRDAFIAALYAGRFAGDAGLPAVAAAVASAPPAADPPSVADELLRGAAGLIAEGWLAGAASAERALAACHAALDSQEVDLQWLFFAVRILAVSLWDPGVWSALAVPMLERVRGAGVLGLVPMAAAQRVGLELFSGNFEEVAALVAEQDAVQAAIGGAASPGSRFALAAFRGDEAEVARLEAATARDALARGDGPFVAILHWSTAMLCNGLGRYDEALAAAQLAVEYPYDLPLSNWALGELVEAAARSGQPAAASAALERLAEMAHACGTDWILGVDARARALVSDHASAEELYRLAIEHLGRTPVRVELARSQLLYGEWLRREQRRVDAREQLRAAYKQLSSIGMDAFADRARSELVATGEKVRKRTVDTRDELTPQELQIARHARDGLSNREIGARLFLSHRTVESHLSKVFAKLEIRSRRELANALSRFDA